MLVPSRSGRELNEQPLLHLPNPENVRLARAFSCAGDECGGGLHFSTMQNFQFPVRYLTLLALAMIWPAVSLAGDFDSALRWRNIGPFRGGRTRAIAGVPSQPNVFYMAQVNGGVFKTTDSGRTWQNRSS